MMFTEPEIRRLDDKVYAVVNAQAAFANPCIVALCLTVLLLVWKGVVRKARWAFWALVGGLVPLQAFGFVSDEFLGHHNIVANVTSSVVLIVGLAMTGHEIFRHSPSQ